jgi:hypothetical protein
VGLTTRSDSKLSRRPRDEAAAADPTTDPRVAETTMNVSAVYGDWIGTAPQGGHLIDPEALRDSLLRNSSY